MEPGDVLTVLSADMTVSVWTGAAERLWGYSVGQVLHGPAERLLVTSAPDIPRVFAGVPWAGRVRIRRRDGHEAPAYLGSRLWTLTAARVGSCGGRVDRGLQRLRTALAAPFSSLDDLCASVIDTLAPDGPLDDDITLLLARTRPAAG
ncbi:hypothetical protein ABZV75_26110 [Streptomyces flaveolus]|uniref:hypothetical protein n=1 Tax=Streptomyces flaveolus TaxID=67297 RepID=UPI0033AEC2D0